MLVVAVAGYSQEESHKMKYNKLTPEEEQVIVHKGTERPFSGKYNDFYEEGIYTCKRCGAALYRSGPPLSAGSSASRGT